MSNRKMLEKFGIELRCLIFEDDLKACRGIV